MSAARKYDPQLDAMLRRTRDAIRRSEDLIAKAKELQRQARKLQHDIQPPCISAPNSPA